MKARLIYFPAAICSVLIIDLAIEITGGLPSQLAHLYYIPVVMSALLLPPRLSVVVALLAGAAVSPLLDPVRSGLGLDVYYDDAAPWNLASNGWILRPVAFVAISYLAGRLLRERTAKTAAEATGAARGEELGLLARIDRMILSGSSEEDAVREIARLVKEFTPGRRAGVLIADRDRKRFRIIDGETVSPALAELLESGIPIDEGVAGWAFAHGRTATSRNVFADARYEQLAEVARRAGYTAAAAAPIMLDNFTLGVLVVTYPGEHDFGPEEVATLERIAGQAAIAISNAKQRESLRRLTHETAIVLADAIESRDPYTGDHCSRLSRFASLTATALELSSTEIETIRLGAALHDVGKIVVPDHILKKPGKLTPDEYAVIKQHCYSGGQICKRVSFLESVYPIVYHHHERFDGRGYPDGIAGHRIPLGARIVAVADAYDAMTSDRTYRKAMPQEEAVAILRDGAASQWDPYIVDKFLSAVGSHAPGRLAAVP
jgi:putative nucleotidyltransferase with HDIG domain